MKRPFREHHLLQLLEQWDAAPNYFALDRFLNSYFRENKAIGSKDRKEICTILYDLIRWRGLLDHLTEPPLSWESRLATYKTMQWKEHINDPSIPPHVRVSFPKTYFNFLTDALGEEKALQFCLTSNEPAPTTVRINPLKTTREALLEKWQPLYDITPTERAPHGITFNKRINFFSLPEFKQGLFEVQDEGSQLLADLVEAGPKDHVLDYCAGSGGKTLAFAHKMHGKGQLYLHDIRTHILAEAKKRMKRAGIENVQFLTYDAPQKKQLKHRMDWVLVDAPCSGSGTLRRNPDMKWKFDPEKFQKLLLTQQEIFETALTFLKKGGKIVYATCSILPQENERQIEFFSKKYSLKVEKKLQTFPEKGKGDGFFAAVMLY